MPTLLQIKVELLNCDYNNANLSSYLFSLADLKHVAVSTNKQSEAKEIWIFEQIVEINQIYLEVYSLLQSEKYYDAWCKLERIEINFLTLKKHFVFNEVDYNLYFIEKTVVQLQTIFPYKLFFSTELIEREKRCSICDKIISVRNPCEHKKGEIYNGEPCYINVTKSEMIGVALVENPVHKYAVAFLTKEDNEKEDKDYHNYAAIKYLMSLLDSPYENWELEIQYHLISHKNYRAFGRNDLCPCGSREKYKKCCLLKEGVKYVHYEFIVNRPSPEVISTSTTEIRS